MLPEAKERGGRFAVDEGYDNGKRVGGFHSLDEVMEYCLKTWVGSEVVVQLSRFQNEDGGEI